MTHRHAQLELPPVSPKSDWRNARDDWKPSKNIRYADRFDKNAWKTGFQSGGADDKVYQPYNWRFIVAILGIVLIIVALVITVYDQVNVSLLVASSLLTLVASGLIFLTSGGMGDLYVEEIVSNVVLLIAGTLSALVLEVLYISKSCPAVLTQDNLFTIFYWGRLVSSGLAILTTGVVIYYV